MQQFDNITDSKCAKSHNDDESIAAHTYDNTCSDPEKNGVPVESSLTENKNCKLVKNNDTVALKSKLKQCRDLVAKITRPHITDVSRLKNS